jgi:hypothetical protein
MAAAELQQKVTRYLCLTIQAPAYKFVNSKHILNGFNEQIEPINIKKSRN